MQFTVGIVGPQDLVTLVEQVAAREFLALHCVGVAYPNESQTVELLRASSSGVDAWLFTGVIPYTLAQEAGVLDRPATYISYTGATLYRLLVELVASGRMTDRISIDTMDREQVVEAFRSAALPVAGVRVMEYRPDRGADRFAEFHRAIAREATGSVAITCVRSVYDEIADEIPAIRLVPAVASVRTALQTVALASLGRASADAQVVLGFIDVSDPDPELSDDVGALAGSLFALHEGHYLLVTTRGAVEDASNGFQQLPLLNRLSSRQLWAHIGLGVGRSAAEAEALARRALARSRTIGPFAAVISLGTGGDVVLAQGGSDETPDAVTAPVSVAVAARRSGLSRVTLKRLKEALDKWGEDGVTAAEVAEVLAIEPRTARQKLKRLENAGVAQPIGRVLVGRTGRPPTIYRIRLGD